MKKYLLLLFFFFLTVTMISAQDQGTPAPVKHPRFHAGLYYSYTGTSMKLTEFSTHSIWYGNDLGTYTADADELARMNDIRTTDNKMNSVMVRAGLVMLDQPQGHWFIDGDLVLGLTANKTQTDLDVPEHNQMTVSSSLKNPEAGLLFNLRYKFNAQWGITAMPEFYYAWGKSDKITDSIYPIATQFVNNFNEDFSYLFGRIALMASFTVKKVTLSAGPGFYYANMVKTYKIERTNPENGYEYYDELKSTLRPKSFLDGCIAVDWTFIDPLTFSLQATVGKDLYINSGLRYNF